MNDASRRISMNFCCTSASLMMSITSGIVYSRGWPSTFGAMNVNVAGGLVVRDDVEPGLLGEPLQYFGPRLSRNSKRHFLFLRARRAGRRGHARRCRGWLRARWPPIHRSERPAHRSSVNRARLAVGNHARALPLRAKLGNPRSPAIVPQPIAAHEGPPLAPPDNRQYRHICPSRMSL